MTAWKLWYHDLFDPASGGLEAEGEGLVEGIALLWRKEASEGIQDDGSRTFTAFSLRWDDGRMDLVVERDSPGLLHLRRWAAADESLFRRVAEAHLRLIERDAVRPGDAAAVILSWAARSADAQGFASGLERL